MTEGPLRRWVVEELGHRLTTGHIWRLGDDLPSSFLRDLLLEKLRREENFVSQGEVPDRRRYHVHDEAVPGRLNK